MARYGEPIALHGVRPAWLHDGEECDVKNFEGWWGINTSGHVRWYRFTHIRLRADHPIYTAGHALAHDPGPCDLLAWLAENPSLELSYEGWEDDNWQVHQVNGGRSDREWTRIAVGSTPAEALAAARRYLAANHGDKQHG